MDKVLYTTGSFCEVKSCLDNKTICTGNVSYMDNERIFLRNIIVLSLHKSFTASITLLSQSRGLQVYTAYVTEIADNCIRLEKLERTVETDRRRDCRVETVLPAIIMSDSDADPIDAVIHNISVGGLMMSLYKPYNIDDIVKIHFPIFGEPCTAICNIVRCVGSVNYSLRQYGCSFVNISNIVRTRLTNYISQVRAEKIKRMFAKKN